MSDNTMNRQTDEISKERIHGASEIEEAIMKAIDTTKGEKKSNAQGAQFSPKSNS